MKEILTVGNRAFEVAGPLTPELKAQVMQQVMDKIQGSGGGYISCGSAEAGIPKLGTAVCGGPYVQNTSHILTGSITSGGTEPFTYTWTITKPDSTTETLDGAVQTYVFAQADTYGIRLDVLDSCVPPRSDFSTCSVTVTPACENPVCNINIA